MAGVRGALPRPAGRSGRFRYRAVQREHVRVAAGCFAQEPETIEKSAREKQVLDFTIKLGPTCATPTDSQPTHFADIVNTMTPRFSRGCASMADGGSEFPPWRNSGLASRSHVDRCRGHRRFRNGAGRTSTTAGKPHRGPWRFPRRKFVQTAAIGAGRLSPAYLGAGPGNRVCRVELRSNLSSAASLHRQQRARGPCKAGSTQRADARGGGRLPLLQPSGQLPEAIRRVHFKVSPRPSSSARAPKSSFGHTNLRRRPKPSSARFRVRRCAGYAELSAPGRGVKLTRNSSSTVEPGGRARARAGFYCNPNNPVATYVARKRARVSPYVRQSPEPTSV